MGCNSNRDQLNRANEKNIWETFHAILALFPRRVQSYIISLELYSVTINAIVNKTAFEDTVFR